jgi:hypothetical protein
MLSDMTGEEAYRTAIHQFADSVEEIRSFWCVDLPMKTKTAAEAAVSIKTLTYYSAVSSNG